MTGGGFIDCELPTDDDGRTYVTDAMLADYPSLAAFFERTRRCWRRDNLRSRWVLETDK